MLVFVDADPIHKALIIFFVLNGLDVRFSKHSAFCYILFWLFSSFAIFQAPMSIKLPLFVIGQFSLFFPLYLGVRVYVCVCQFHFPPTHCLLFQRQFLYVREFEWEFFFLEQHQPKNRFVLNHMLWLRSTTCLACSAVPHTVAYSNIDSIYKAWRSVAATEYIL